MYKLYTYSLSQDKREILVCFPTGVKHNPLPPEMLKIIMNAKEQNDEEAKKQLENVYEYFHEQQNKQNTGKADFMKYQKNSANIRGSSDDSLDEGTFI